VSRAADEAVRALLGPLLAARPGPSQWRLLSWDTDQGVTLTLEKGERRVLVELSARDEARPSLTRTARFNLVARRLSEGEVDLGADERRAVEQLAGLLRAREGLLPVLPRPEASPRAAVREVEVDRVLVDEGAGRYYVNPYVGCVIGCAFCWAAEGADLSRSLEGLPTAPWGRWVDVKVNASAVLRRELAQHAPGTVRLSPVVTDPYQPLERKYRVTRGCLEAMADAGFTPVVLTREARVLEDLDVLRRCPGAAVGLSIPTDDDAVRAAFEPGASPIAARLDALRRLHAAGVRTFAVVQPALPMDAARLVAEVAPFVRAVRVDRMHAVERARPLYERAGRRDAMTDGFADALVRELTAGFAARGVRVDALDDLAAALG
jgi:DNA repair photolyase